MGDFYTTGDWTPNEGEEDAFVEAWTAFATWAAAMPGAGTLRLVRDTADPRHFVSLGDWESGDAAHDWKASPEFRERMGSVQKHVERFVPADLELVATAD